MNDKICVVDDPYKDNKIYSVRIINFHAEGYLYLNIIGKGKANIYRINFDTAIKKANWLKNWRK